MLNDFFRDKIKSLLIGEIYNSELMEILKKLSLGIDSIDSFKKEVYFLKKSECTKAYLHFVELCVEDHDLSDVEIEELRKFQKFLNVYDDEIIEYYPGRVGAIVRKAFYNSSGVLTADKKLSDLVQWSLGLSFDDLNDIKI